jgi:hypothetical protein
MPSKDHSDKEAEEVFLQSKRPDNGRYLLKVDKQTKGSYKTPEAAQSAALEIKKAFRSFKFRFMIASTTRPGWLSYRAPPRKQRVAHAAGCRGANRPFAAGNANDIYRFPVSRGMSE